MKHQDLKSVSADELWSLHEQVASELVRKIAAAKVRLDQRLRRLALRAFNGKMSSPRVTPAGSR
jgi:hypothetical protein